MTHSNDTKDPRQRPAAEAALASGISLREANDADLTAVLGVQREAFNRVAARGGFDPCELPPVRETLEDLRELRASGTRTLVATVEDGGCERIVGTVRGFERPDGTVEVGRLAVDGAFVRRGIARALMRGLEVAYPSALRFELFTGSESTDALALYASLGYRVYAREIFEDWTLVRLEKDAENARTDAGPVTHDS